MQTEPNDRIYRFVEMIALGNVDIIRTEIEPYFFATDIRRILFDLSDVRICDIYGIELFLYCQRLAEQNGKLLVLCQTSKVVKEALQHAEIIQSFTFCDDMSLSQ